MPIELNEWFLRNSGRGMHWYLRRLSGPETLACGIRQPGPWFPKEFLFELFPALNRPRELNPDTSFDLHIDSHDHHRRARAVWHNSKLHSGTRDETRLYEQGGPVSALKDPESTGASVVFAFSEATPDSEAACNVWVCRNASDEDEVDSWYGPIEPGIGVAVIPHPDTVSDFTSGSMRNNYWFERSETPSARGIH